MQPRLSALKLMTGLSSKLGKAEMLEAPLFVNSAHLERLRPFRQVTEQKGEHLQDQR